MVSTRALYFASSDCFPLGVVSHCLWTSPWFLEHLGDIYKQVMSWYDLAYMHFLVFLRLHLFIYELPNLLFVPHLSMLHWGLAPSNCYPRDMPPGNTLPCLRHQALTPLCFHHPRCNISARMTCSHCWNTCVPKTLEHIRAAMTYMIWHKEHLGTSVYSKKFTFPFLFLSVMSPFMVFLSSFTSA